MASAFQPGAFQSGAFQIEATVVTRPRGWDDAERRTPIIIVEYEDEPEQPKARKPKRRRKAPAYVPEPDFVPVEFPAFVQPDLPPLPARSIDYSQLAIAQWLQQQAALEAAQDEEAVELLLLTVN